MKRMASAEPPKEEPASSHRPVFPDRLNPIFGTGGEETATVADKGAERRLVEMNKKNHNCFHETSI